MAPSDPRRPAIVLIVEDGPVQRLALIDLGRGAGLEVLEAWNADSAVAILEGRTDVRLVLTDVAMPGSMHGVRLAVAIRDRWPPLEMILISVGSPTDVSTLPARVELRPKPIQAHRILSACVGWRRSKTTGVPGSCPRLEPRLRRRPIRAALKDDVWLSESTVSGQVRA